MKIHKRYYYRIGIVFGIVLLSGLYIVRTNLLKTNILKSALSDAGEEYFLLVPSGLINDELHWLYTGADEVYIGNSRINNGEICHMGSGIYEVRLCGQDYSNSFWLRVMESSAINTLFLTTDSGSLEYLHEAKSNSEGGEYTLYDQRGICVASGDIDEMHCRGNASWEDTDKKSYQLKLDIELKDTAFLWNKQEGFLARKDI